MTGSEPAWVHTAGPFKALHHRFAIRTSDPVFGNYLEYLWGACLADVNPQMAYGLEAAGGTHRLYVDDHLLSEHQNPSIALRDLVRRVNADVIAAASEFVVIHAAGAARDGVGVLFPAPTESGKTTLVAGLVRAGWDYLSDEAVAVDPVSLELHPYPKPLSIDPGSWGVLADLRPELPEALTPYVIAQWQVPPHAIRPHAPTGPVLPAVVIGPVYAAGAATVLQPLTGAAGLMLLAESCFMVRQGGPRSLKALAGVARRCMSYTLTVADLDEACDQVLEVVRAA